MALPQCASFTAHLPEEYPLQGPGVQAPDEPQPALQHLTTAHLKRALRYGPLLQCSSLLVRGGRGASSSQLREADITAELHRRHRLLSRDSGMSQQSLTGVGPMTGSFELAQGRSTRSSLQPSFRALQDRTSCQETCIWQHSRQLVA